MEKTKRHENDNRIQVLPFAGCRLQIPVKTETNEGESPIIESQKIKL